MVIVELMSTLSLYPSLKGILKLFQKVFFKMKTFFLFFFSGWSMSSKLSCEKKIVYFRLPLKLFNLKFSPQHFFISYTLVIYGILVGQCC